MGMLMLEMKRGNGWPPFSCWLGLCSLPLKFCRQCRYCVASPKTPGGTPGRCSAPVVKGCLALIHWHNSTQREAGTSNRSGSIIRHNSHSACGLFSALLLLFTTSCVQNGVISSQAQCRSSGLCFAGFHFNVVFSFPIIQQVSVPITVK